MYNGEEWFATAEEWREADAVKSENQARVGG